MSRGIKDVMSSPPVLIEAEATLLDAAKLMAEKGVGAVGVTDGGQFAGVLTDRDIVVRGLAGDLDATTTPVGQVATSDPVTVQPSCSLEEAEQLMVKRRVRRLFVVDGSDVVGLVSNDDLAAIRDERSVEARQLQATEETLLRGFQGHTGQGE
jgi:CBS domain-containing protein